MRPVLHCFIAEPLHNSTESKNHTLTRIECEPVATGAADQGNYDLPYLSCQLNFPFHVCTTQSFCNGRKVTAENFLNVFRDVHVLHLGAVLLPECQVGDP